MYKGLKVSKDVRGEDTDFGHEPCQKGGGGGLMGVVVVGMARLPSFLRRSWLRKVSD